MSAMCTNKSTVFMALIGLGTGIHFLYVYFWLYYIFDFYCIAVPYPIKWNIYTRVYTTHKSLNWSCLKMLTCKIKLVGAQETCFIVPMRGDGWWSGGISILPQAPLTSVVDIVLERLIDLISH